MQDCQESILMSFLYVDLSKSVCYSFAEYIRRQSVEQRTIFRRRNHISPQFTIMVFNVLVQSFVNSLQLSVKGIESQWHNIKVFVFVKKLINYKRFKISGEILLPGEICFFALEILVAFMQYFKN